MMTVGRTVSRIGALLVAVLGGVLFVACRAPSDDFKTTAYMMRLGEETRDRSGRALGEAVVPPEAQRPVVVPIVVGEPLPFHFVRASDESVLPTEIDVTRPQERVVAPIAIDRERLTTFLRTKYEIGIVDIKTINGRFTGDENILRVEFMAASRNEEEILRDFMFICAAAVGMDTESTVDVIVGLATDPQLLPWVRLRVDVASFAAYQAGDLSLEEWKNEIEIQRF